MEELRLVPKEEIRRFISDEELSSRLIDALSKTAE